MVVVDVELATSATDSSSGPQQGRDATEVVRKTLNDFGLPNEAVDIELPYTDKILCSARPAEVAIAKVFAKICQTNLIVANVSDAQDTW